MKYYKQIVFCFVIMCIPFSCEAWDNPTYINIWDSPASDNGIARIPGSWQESKREEPITTREPLINTDENVESDNYFIPSPKLPGALLEPGCIANEYYENLQNVGFIDAGFYQGSRVFLLRNTNNVVQLCGIITVSEKDNHVTGTSLFIFGDCRKTMGYLGFIIPDGTPAGDYQNSVGTGGSDPVAAANNMVLPAVNDTFMPRPLGFTSHLPVATAEALLESEGFLKIDSYSYCLDDGSVSAKLAVNEGEVVGMKFMMLRESIPGLAIMGKLYVFPTDQQTSLEFISAKIEGNGCAQGVCKEMIFQFW